MNRIENQTFENVVINFDGYTYINCTFNRCQLLFAGMAPAQYENCRFRADCVWTFAGPAQNTLSFLAGIYLLAPAGKELVDKIFQQIRGEQDPQQSPVIQPEKSGDLVN